MRDLADEGYAILFFSTDMQELLHVADRVAVLLRRNRRGLLAGSEVTEEAILRAAIGARDGGVTAQTHLDDPAQVAVPEAELAAGVARGDRRRVDART